MLSRLDILVCGNSDPGTSGIISPFTDMEGLYFDASDEPDEFYVDLINDIDKKMKEDGFTYVKCEFDNPNDYYDALDNMNKYIRDNVSLYGTSRENHYEIVVNEDSDMDDTTKPTTVALRKKKKVKLEESK